MLLLNREDIRKVFTMRDAIEADKKAFQLVVEGKCDAPLRTNIQAPKQNGVFLFMPAYVEELEAYGARILPAKSPDEAIGDADLLITVTPSSRPVFDGAKVKAGATVSCVGAYQPHMQEMDPVILTRASKIYFDSREAVLAESGDILIPLADGTIREEDFTGDLGNVISGELVGRENDGERLRSIKK